MEQGPFYSIAFRTVLSISASCCPFTEFPWFARSSLVALAPARIYMVTSSRKHQNLLSSMYISKLPRRLERKWARAAVTAGWAALLSPAAPRASIYRSTAAWINLCCATVSAKVSRPSADQTSSHFSDYSPRVSQILSFSSLGQTPHDLVHNPTMALYPPPRRPKSSSSRSRPCLSLPPSGRNSRSSRAPSGWFLSSRA